MICRRISLDPTDARVCIDCYVPEQPHADARAAMLVIPGGGYQALALDREGEAIALAFASRGLAAFVLSYRVGGDTDRFPKQLIDASRAILYIRTHAEELCVDPARVYAVGFSAGGHLAGSLATMHALPAVTEPLGISAEENRPTAVILCYPVVSAYAHAHTTSIKNLLGTPFNELTEEQRRLVSLEKNVTERTCPMFLWHTAEDPWVPPAGTLLLAEALLSAHVPVMMHLYPHGPHGMALSNNVTRAGNDAWVDPLCEGWVDTALLWFDRLWETGHR